MKLATLRDGTPVGRLHVVSRDLKHAAPAAASKTLPQALEVWTGVVADLTAEYETLNSGKAANAIAFDPSAAMAPLPRAWRWLDLRKPWQPATPWTRPSASRRSGPTGR
jgi:fumarylacetoacetate (FAA) hydrolase